MNKVNAGIKAIIGILVIFVLSVLLSGCCSERRGAVTTGYSEKYKDYVQSNFIKIDEYNNWNIVYAADTRVMYMYNIYGDAITPLYNPDGSLVLFEE